VVSMPRGHAEIGPLGRRSRACSACSGASFVPHSGQVSKPTAAPPMNTAVLCRSTVTSVRTVRLAVLAVAPHRKELARWLSH
jgi:hypothetical protein